MINDCGHVILDQYVRPDKPVLDYRTASSGITPQVIDNAPPLHEIQPMLTELFQGRTIVGHDIQHDFRVMPSLMHLII